jgi:hypothetical protein
MCATETRPAPSRSLLQDRRARHISCALFPFCFHTTGPPLARVWSIALHAHTPAESSRAGHWQNTSARIRKRAGSIPLGPPPSLCRATLQLLSHRARPRCTLTRSRPELVQQGRRYALHAAALYIVALHSYSSFSCCRTRASPRPCRVAGPSAAVLAKLPRCNTTAYVCLRVVILHGYFSWRTTPARTAHVPLTPSLQRLMPHHSPAPSPAPVRRTSPVLLLHLCAPLRAAST